MALSFATGMNLIDSADLETDWSPYKLTAGGGTPGIVQSTDIVVEGAACNCLKPTASKDVGLSFDYYNANGNTVLDLTVVGNEVIAVWIQVTSKATLQTWADGGIYIGVCSVDSAPTSSNAWSKWYVGGNDQYKGGWQLYLIDTRKTPSLTSSGGADLSSVYQIFFGTLAGAVVPRAESFYVDASWYGRPIYSLEGDGALSADWVDFLSDSVTNENGLIQDINGAYELSCGIKLGDDAQVATTTFEDQTNQGINFKRHVYYEGGPADALNYTDYYKLIAQGAASFGTSITIGQPVGSDAGILGGTIKSLDPTNVPVTVDFDTDQAHITALNLYGVIWQDITNFFKIGANTAFKVFSNQFVGCTIIDPVGGPQLRNCLFIGTVDSYSGGFPNGSALLWNPAMNIEVCQFIANAHGTYDPHAIRVDAAGEIDFTKLSFSGNDYDVHFTPGSGDLIVNKLGGSNPSTAEIEGTGSVDFTATFSFEVTGLELNTEVTIVTAGTTTVLYNVENATTSDGDGKYKIAYSHSGGASIDVLIHHVDYQPDISNIYALTLPNADSAAKVGMFIDLNYENPV